MKTGIFIAVLLHVAILLFGGIIFGRHEEKKQVTWLDPDAGAVDEQKPEEQKTPEEQKEEEPIEQVKDAPPNASVAVMDRPVAGPPALDQISLGQMENILSGGAGGADFGQGGSITSRGVIGGDPSRKGGDGPGDTEEAFSASEIDQKPRAVFQAAPVFPAELRGKNMDGAVVVIFIVSPDGRVQSQRVESSNHPAFDRPALDAVKQWKFEAGMRAGQRVSTRMRVTIRFQRS